MNKNFFEFLWYDLDFSGILFILMILFLAPPTLVGSYFLTKKVVCSISPEVCIERQ